MIKYLIVFSTAALLICCSNYSDDNKNHAKTTGDKIVAKIGSEYITHEQLQDAISRLPVKQRILIQSSASQRNKFIESYINKQILYKEALRRGYGEKEDFKKTVEEYKKKILIKNLTDDLLKNEISDNELEQYYVLNREKYESASITQVSVIPKNKDSQDLSSLQNLLKSISTNLQNGVGTHELKKHSDYNIKIKENIEITKDKYNKTLADIIFTMKKGQVSKPVKLGNSFIVLKIIEGPDYIPFKKVKNDIKFEIRKNNLEDYLKNLKATESIEIYSENIYMEKNNNENN